MILNLHRDIKVQKLTIGAERAPLLVIDNFLSDPDKLVRRATSRSFNAHSPYFPGIRTEVPLGYQQLFERDLKPLLFEYFGLRGTSFRFAMCHYSLITTSPSQLGFLQRIPHIDSVEGNALASVHYLFTRKLGGTAFYRHRQTGFEYVDREREARYFRALEDEKSGPDAPPAEYIRGDTPLFERIGVQDGVFNRILIYRRNSLHSADLPIGFVPDPDPSSGRLSINSFIDLV